MKRLLLVLLITACTPAQVLVVDGIRVYPQYWADAVRHVQPMASYELQCPPEGVQLHLLRRQGRLPAEIAAVGCGGTHQYVRLGYRWYNVLDPTLPDRRHAAAQSEAGAVHHRQMLNRLRR